MTDKQKSQIPKASPLHLVLVTPEIPANTGNVARMCACTGVALHLIEPLGFTMDDRLMRRAGLDYWKDCQLTTHLEFSQVEQELPQAGYHFLSARAQASLYERTIQPGDVLVMGCETTGLTKHFLEQNERTAHTCCLPMPGRGRSLNLSTASGIVVYEALRQLGLLHATKEP